MRRGGGLFTRSGRCRPGLFALPVVVAVSAALALSGCSGAEPGPVRSAAPAGEAPSATYRPVGPTASGTTPAPRATFQTGGTAAQNKAYFDRVNLATLAAKPAAQGRDFIDGLVAAGFPKADMQVTPDSTTIGLKANSIQFSVRLGDSCLIGQNGADAGGYNSMVAPVLSTGECLIGQTRPIDW